MGASVYAHTCLAAASVKTQITGLAQLGFHGYLFMCGFSMWSFQHVGFRIAGLMCQLGLPRSMYRESQAEAVLPFPTLPWKL